jgi:hypothetical protein
VFPSCWNRWSWLFCSAKLLVTMSNKCDLSLSIGNQDDQLEK